jgi:hypothetical protein
VLVEMVKWRRVDRWRLRTVLWLALLPNSASSSGHPKATFRSGKRICCLGEYGFIAAFPSGAWSTSGIERGSARISLQRYPVSHIHLVPGNLMWVLLTGYPIMVGVMVGSGSQELIARFGPIISTEALWHMWIIHGTNWLIIPPFY